jgi:hypothetical protein
MKQLHCAGIGATQKQAAPITPRKEEKLWESGQLGAHSAKSLLNTVFFYNCKLFGLRKVFFKTCANDAAISMLTF